MKYELLTLPVMDEVGVVIRVEVGCGFSQRSGAIRALVTATGQMQFNRKFWDTEN
jgi:hypothetical protein